MQFDTPGRLAYSPVAHSSQEYFVATPAGWYVPDAHRTQSDTELLDAIWPTPHEMHSVTVEMVVGWYLPFSQVSQLVTKLFTATWPLAHVLHVSESSGSYDVGTWSLYLPIVQFVHSDTRACRAYTPGTHDVHPPGA